MTVGGSDAELGLLAVAVAALVEKLEVCGRRRPALLDEVRRQSRAWPCLEGTTGPVELDLREGDDVMTPLLVTRTEAAGLLRLSERQIARAVAEGRLRAVREGRAVRFRVQDLQAYADSLTEKSWGPCGLEGGPVSADQEGLS